jgi:hypothetical protein
MSEQQEMSVAITGLGIAYIDWHDGRPPRTGVEGQDARHHGEMAAFCAGWQARDAENERLSKALAERDAAGNSLAGYAETLLEVIEHPVYRVDLVTFIARWRALAAAPGAPSAAPDGREGG